MKPKLSLTVIALLLSFTSLPPIKILSTVQTEKPIALVKLATVREWPTIATKSQIPVAAPTPVEQQATAQVPTPSAGCNGYLTLFSQYNWNVQDAIAICNAESSGNPNATHYDANGSVDMGLMQINSVHDNMVSSPSQLYDPATNISVAYQIYSQSGWYAWSTAWVIGL